MMRCSSWMLVMSLSCVCILYLLVRNAFYDDYYGISSVDRAHFGEMISDSKQLRRVRSTTNGNADRVQMHVPKIVHQMWKSGSDPPPETVRWQKGCKKLNPDLEFRMYDDDDLARFVEREYPKYLPLFRALSGVYMADMARVLLTYHYGGIYMDLDFYCYRPFSCLEDMVDILSFNQDRSRGRGRSGETPDVLAVSLEPSVHANIFRSKERVVIQDFYMATPRHPFLEWFLDDRLVTYLRDIEQEKDPFKGPFSYSIENDIDMWMKVAGYKELTLDDRVAIAEKSRLRTKFNIQDTVYGGTIVELKEDILHSLVDSTNPRLTKVCSDRKNINDLNAESCDYVNKKKFFRPSTQSIAVHMWTHTFLGWSFLRGVYMWARYGYVERSLSPTTTCPNVDV